MSKSFTADHSLAAMTEGHEAHAAPERNAADTAETNLAPEISDPPTCGSTPGKKTKSHLASSARRKSKSHVPPPTLKQRFGLPDGFVPRLQRYGRSVLLELNIYRLPNGVEFLPTHPMGTLGSRQHLYALLTIEQYLARRRGSIYIRNDGRIFDYSVDRGLPGGDIFDTGYTIYDLERTGKYAPPLKQTRKKIEAARYRGAAAGAQGGKR